MARVSIVKWNPKEA